MRPASAVVTMPAVGAPVTAFGVEPETEPNITVECPHGIIAPAPCGDCFREAYFGSEPTTDLDLDLVTPFAEEPVTATYRPTIPVPTGEYVRRLSGAEGEW